MKTSFYTLSFVLAIFFYLPTQAQIYVNAAATGNNDGTSWADAYTELSTALASASTGEVWVASGVYKPSAAVIDSTTTFKVTNSFPALYGGFSGTETSAADRDIAANITTLSGDINDDDTAGDFENNKSDNVQHIMVVDSLLTGTVVIDGFTFMGGQSSNFNDQDEIFWRGGGIFSSSTIAVKNCTFTNNFARSGSGVYISPYAGGGNFSTFDNCIFEGNLAGSQSAGIYLEGLLGVTINDCIFRNNETTRGAFYPAFCENTTLNSCTFEANIASSITGFGGAMFSWQNVDFKVNDCTFINNEAGNGAVIYHDGRDSAVDPTNLVFTGCNFEGNTTSDFGGGIIYAFSSSYTMEDCIADANISANGSHLFNSGENMDVILKNNTFKNGSSTFGGAATCYGANAVYTIENCTFERGTAATSAGALIIGFEAVANISDCVFKSNTAGFGGAVYVQNDLTEVNFTNCEFVENTSEDNAGAMFIGGAVTSVVDKCIFNLNNSDFGGALTVSDFSDTTYQADFTMRDCVFDFNHAITQGAAFNLVDADADISNTLFRGNFLTNGVAGGAMSFNGTDSQTVVINLTNCTMVANEGSLGSGISAYTEPTPEALLTINMQNNLFFNQGENYAVEDGTPMLVSLGGNMLPDNSAAEWLTHPKDQHEVFDMGFVDLENFDIHLTAASPAINAGVNDGAPTLDLDGNPRVGDVDVGVYEFQDVVSAEEIISDEDAINIFPNPVKDVLTYELDNDWSGELTVIVYNVTGQEVHRHRTYKATDWHQHQVQLAELSKGMYDLYITNGTQAMSRKFVKQ